MMKDVKSLCAENYGVSITVRGVYVPPSRKKAANNQTPLFD